MKTEIAIRTLGILGLIIIHFERHAAKMRNKRKDWGIFNFYPLYDVTPILPKPLH